MIVFPAHIFSLRRFALAAIGLLLTSTVVSAVREDEPRLLDESEYRSQLEEVVVIGKDPGWREQEKEEWRPEQFELPTLSSESRIQWFPQYSKDERDNYSGVRDRTGEKPEFQIFKWKF